MCQPPENVRKKSRGTPNSVVRSPISSERSSDRTTSNGAFGAEQHREFLRLHTRHQHRVLAYIFTLVPNRADAEDLLQDTAVLLWEKFDQFEPGTDFVAWACRVAYWKIANHRKRFARANLLFSDELLAAVAQRTIELAPELDDRREALRQCMKRLEDRDRRMITARYEPGGNARQAAEASRRTLPATYKALYRIRRALFDCVTLRIAEGSSR